MAVHVQTEGDILSFSSEKKMKLLATMFESNPKTKIIFNR